MAMSSASGFPVSVFGWFTLPELVAPDKELKHTLAELHEVMAWVLIVMVSLHVMAALLHDAPEYVVGDMISPFKAVIGGDYKAVVHRLLNAIHLRFGLPKEQPEALLERIKAADHMAAYFEATELAGFDEEEARRIFGQPQIHSAIYETLLYPWGADIAKVRFLDRFTQLEKL